MNLRKLTYLAANNVKIAVDCPTALIVQAKQNQINQTN